MRDRARRTSSLLKGRPRRRFTEYTVLRGSIARRIRAARPTIRSPLSANETTDGISVPPLASVSTWGRPRWRRRPRSWWFQGRFQQRVRPSCPDCNRAHGLRREIAVEGLCDASAHPPLEGPHPAVVGSGEAPHDLLVQSRVGRRGEAPELGLDLEGDRVGLPLQHRPPPGEARRQREEPVDQHHPGPREALELPHVHQLVAEHLVPRPVRPGLPGGGNPDRRPEGGDVVGQVAILPAEGEHPQRAVDESLDRPASTG